MQYIMEYGHNARTTHSTVANDTSSRSHAICQIRIESDYFQNTKKLILCDLAGSERAGDCQSNSRQRRIEGAEINKSLLALKECIRAMESNNKEHQKARMGLGNKKERKNHVPFRGSKLTLTLRDSFLNPNSCVFMIACVSPGHKSVDHSINTLRYADRLLQKKNKKIDPNLAIYLDDNGNPMRGPASKGKKTWKKKKVTKHPKKEKAGYVFEMPNSQRNRIHSPIIPKVDRKGIKTFNNLDFDKNFNSNSNSNQGSRLRNKLENQRRFVSDNSIPIDK